MIFTAILFSFFLFTEIKIINIIKILKTRVTSNVSRDLSLFSSNFQEPNIFNQNFKLSNDPFPSNSQKKTLCINHQSGRL